MFGFCSDFVRLLFGTNAEPFCLLRSIMDENFDQILDSFPKKQSRSRLEPYGRLIRELLRRRRTYREIACVLLDRFHLHVSISTIHGFVRRWTIPAGKARNTNGPRPDQPTRGNPVGLAGKRKMDPLGTPMAFDEVRRRIAALKSRPIPATETNTTIFHYDPEQPLHLPSNSQKKESD
jgi:hypothetical protein